MTSRAMGSTLLPFRFLHLVSCFRVIGLISDNGIWFMSEVKNMRPAKEFSAAREHFGETSTLEHLFPV